jgi:hypothetical protein
MDEVHMDLVEVKCELDTVCQEVEGFDLNGLHEQLLPASKQAKTQKAGDKNLKKGKSKKKSALRRSERLNPRKAVNVLTQRKCHAKTFIEPAPATVVLGIVKEIEERKVVMKEQRRKKFTCLPCDRSFSK